MRGNAKGEWTENIFSNPDKEGIMLAPIVKRPVSLINFLRQVFIWKCIEDEER
jgi:hypothetical protein